MKRISQLFDVSNKMAQWCHPGTPVRSPWTVILAGSGADVSKHRPKNSPLLTWRECIKKIWKQDPSRQSSLFCADDVFNLLKPGINLKNNC